MVAHGRHQTRTTGDPTAHAPMIAIREAARRLGRLSLNGLTLFTVVEPCSMCVGALLQSDADGLVYAIPDPLEGACGSALQLAQSSHATRDLEVVSGILQADALELARGGTSPRSAAARGAALGL
jgi:tRNA(adenine34) deaminase